MHLITNARLYAPEQQGIRHLLIAADHILWAGEDVPDLPSSLGARTFDAQGRAVIPGLIDAHAHFTGGGGESGFRSRVPPVPLSRFTRAGVTSAVGVLGTDDVTRNTDSLVAQTRGLIEDGISAWCHTGGYHVPPVTLTGSVLRDIVSIDCIIGVGELAISDHRSSQPTLDELMRIAGEAHVAGMMTGKAGIVHLHLGDGERGLDLVRRALSESEIPARVYNPTHVNRRKALFDEAIALAANGCTIDLTAFPVAEDDDAWSADQAIIKYLDSDAPVSNLTVSSDGGGCLPVFDENGVLTHMDVGDSCELMIALRAVVASGLALENALPFFTSNVADGLRLSRKGRIGPGMDADLVVLDEHNNIDAVMARGHWHVRDGKQEIKGMFEGE